MRDAPQDAITREEQSALRDAADALLFAEAYDEVVRRVLAEVREVASAIRRSAHDPWVDQLAIDLEDCGPAAGQPAVTRGAAPVPSVAAVPRGNRRAAG